MTSVRNAFQELYRNLSISKYCWMLFFIIDFDFDIQLSFSVSMIKIPRFLQKPLDIIKHQDPLIARVAPLESSR